jgi:hypothetical protein
MQWAPKNSRLFSRLNLTDFGPSRVGLSPFFTVCRGAGFKVQPALPHPVIWFAAQTMATIQV